MDVTRLLARQLKRTLGVADVSAAALAAAVGELAADPHKLATALQALVAQVNSAYLQYDRDLTLASRSLEISSRELLDANEQIRAEAEAQERALESLRDAVRRLAADAGVPPLESAAGIEALSERVAQLISERRQANELLLTAIENLNESFSLCDAEGRYVVTNRRFRENNAEIAEYIRPGCRYEDALRAGIANGIYVEAIGREEEWVQERLARRRDLNSKPFEQQRKGGVWLLYKETHLADGSIITIGLDITERKRIEQAIADSEARFRGLTELSSDWYWEQDAELRFVSTAGRTAERGGIGAEVHVGKTRWELPGTSPVNCTWDEHKAALAALRSFHDLLLRRESADGSVHFVQVSGMPMFDGDGKFAGYRGIASDVTEKHRAAEALREAKDAADAANEAKSLFLANMSHEIRTPMNGLLGMAELLLGENLSPSQREKAELLYASGRSLLAIINDVLDFSKVEAGQLKLERVGFDLAELIERATQLHALAAQQKSVSLEVRVDADVPARVTGDPLRIGQVLNNLLGNACKFTERGQVVLRVQNITSEPPHSGAAIWLRFEIEDSGIGLTDAQIGRLFQPFTQADASTTRRFGGTGLGLAISKHLVEAMGGAIGAHGRSGNGALFWFELPVAAAAEATDFVASPAVPALSPAIRPLTGLNVLLVEDNAVNLMVASTMLRSAGANVTTAGNGAIAIAKLRETTFDAVMMDCQMPVMDGFEAVQAWRAEEAASGRGRTPIIALTANAMVGDREKCLAAGFDDHLGKPFRREQLEHTLARWLPARSPAASESSAIASPLSAA